MGKPDVGRQDEAKNSGAAEDGDATKEVSADAWLAESEPNKDSPDETPETSTGTPLAVDDASLTVDIDPSIIPPPADHRPSASGIDSTTDETSTTDKTSTADGKAEEGKAEEGKAKGGKAAEGKAAEPAETADGSKPKESDQSKPDNKPKPDNTDETADIPKSDAVDEPENPESDQAKSDKTPLDKTDKSDETKSRKSESDKTDETDKSDETESRKSESDKTDETESRKSESDETDKSDETESGKSESDKTDKPREVAPDKAEESAEPETEKPESDDKQRLAPLRGKRGLALVGVAASYLVISGAWGIDMLAHSGSPARGVAIADINVSNASPDEVQAAIDQVDQRLSDSDLAVTIDGSTLASHPADLGAKVDDDALTEAALTARRGGFLPWRPLRWLFGLASVKTVDPIYQIDEGVAEESVVNVLAPILTETIEPGIEVGSDDLLMPTEPQTGRTVASDEISAKLLVALQNDDPYEVTLEAVDADPQLDFDEVATLTGELNEMTAQGLTVRVLDQTTVAEPAMLRSWLELDQTDTVNWVVNEELALSDLRPMFTALGNQDQQAGFAIVEGEPIVIPASDSVVCCDTGAGAALAEAIAEPIPIPDPEEEAPVDGAPQTLRSVVLDPIITGDTEAVQELESLGIKELVSTFTTNHACCQNRVKNIQRFADLTQGAIIRPGETFSFNDYVGRRTVEKGFFADGAIAQGNFEQQVGGGISQYATTFFNASFFAGIEFVEYQSHSIYISRYPRGREATISWPRPDLEVRNNTPYGILIWNEYTPNSITVSFYSTKHLEVEALGLLRSSDRQCRIDITPREIRDLDGNLISEDRVFAAYRPGEGLDCNGNSTTPEEEPNAAATTEETTTTTAAAPASNPAPPPDSQPTVTVAPTPTQPPPTEATEVSSDQG